MVSRPFADRTSVAGVEEQEVPGAVGVLGLALGKADLAHHRGLLVTQHAGDRELRAQWALGPGLSEAIPGHRWHDRRKHLPRNAEKRKQLVVPFEGFQVHQHRAAGVGHIGDVLPAIRTAREVPQQPAVGRAEDRVSYFRICAQAFDVLQQPLDLSGGEVGGWG